MSRLLKDHLRKSAAFHKDMAESHADAGSSAHALGRLHDNEISTKFHALGNAHENIAKAHAAHTEDCLEACEKASDADDLTKIVPDGVRSVIPYVQQPYGSALPENVTAVPRFGQPSLPQRPNVPTEFEFLTKMDDDE